MVYSYSLSKAVIIALITYFVASNDIVDAQQCKNLCGSNNQQLQVQQCATQTVTSKPFAPCCDNGDGRINCDGGRKCRSVVFSGIVGCSDPGQGELHCINPAETVFMTIDIATQSQPGACCAECSCSGDPHCYAFGSKTDDFIVCDGRDVSKGCSVTKSVCLTQKDPTGAVCVYNANNGTCTQDPSSSSPTMLFYQAGNTAITLNLGDRGVINGIVIKQGNNLLSLTADDCIAYPNDPWIGTPIGVLESEKHGKVWTYLMPLISAQLTVTCVARGTVVKNPRLDVSIINLSSTPGGVPSGVTGFCGTGKIDKLKATSDVSDAIRLGSLCSNQPIAETAKFFNNGKAVNNINAFINKWCNKYMSGVDSSATAGVQACVNNIKSKSGTGWAKVFCTANTVVSKDLTECDATQDCKICTTDVEDFGWAYAIDKWDATKQTGPKPGGTCIPIDKLPDDLLECQRGIRIQYFDTTTNEWITYKAIPQGYTLCDSSGSFNSNDDPLLFSNDIRFTECGNALLPPNTCPDQLAELCNAEDGFVVTIDTVKQTETPQLGIVDLVDKGSLVCNPAMYPNNPNGCFEEQLNPCPTCTGKCKPTGYNTPCDNSPDACGTCPDPFS